jgi:ATP-binding protein involved in chromosome partitioning
VASDPESAHAKAYLAIARQVQAGLSGKTRAAPRIVIE